MFAGRLAAPGGSPIDVALAVKAASRPPDLVGLELWLEGIAALFTDSYATAVPISARAHSAFDVGDMPASEQVRWKWLATVLSRPSVGRLAVASDFRIACADRSGSGRARGASACVEPARLCASLLRRADRRPHCSSMRSGRRARRQAANLTPYGRLDSPHYAAASQRRSL